MGTVVRYPGGLPADCGRHEVDEHGNKFTIRVKGVRWFTWITPSALDLILFKPYTREAYPKYVNFDAIDVASYKDIPVDYDGIMVPVTLLDYFNLTSSRSSATVATAARWPRSECDNWGATSSRRIEPGAAQVAAVRECGCWGSVSPNIELCSSASWFVGNSRSTPTSGCGHTRMTITTTIGDPQ